MADRSAVHERLARNRFVTDEEMSHIEVDQDVVRATGCGPMLERICPARVYEVLPDGGLTATYAACLECGTCRALAPAGALTWHYPRGGYGVVLREG